MIRDYKVLVVPVRFVYVRKLYLNFGIKCLHCMAKLLFESSVWDFTVSEEFKLLVLIVILLDIWWCTLTLVLAIVQHTHWKQETLSIFAATDMFSHILRKWSNVTFITTILCLPPSFFFFFCLFNAGEFCIVLMWGSIATVYLHTYKIQTHGTLLEVYCMEVMFYSEKLQLVQLTWVWSL